MQLRVNVKLSYVSQLGKELDKEAVPSKPATPGPQRQVEKPEPTEAAPTETTG